MVEELGFQDVSIMSIDCEVDSNISLVDGDLDGQMKELSKRVEKMRVHCNPK